MNKSNDINTGYALIPMSDITDTARKIAVVWMECEDRNKHKLASDIMNYANNFAAPLRKEILDLKAEIEKRDEILNSLLENPYPTDIFPEIQTKVLKNIHEMLQEKFNLPLDRLTAHIGRLLRKPYQTEIKKLKGN